MRSTRLSLYVVSLFLVTASSVDAQKDGPLVGKPMPALELSHALQGDPWSIASTKGSIVVLDIFQIGCPTCMSNSLPAAQKMFEHFKGDDRIKVVAVATAFEKQQYPWMADEAQIKATLSQKKWEFPVMRDKDEKSVKIVGLGNSYGTPTTVVIDAEGIVRWHGFNPTAETARQIDETVERLLATFWVPAIENLSPRLQSYASGQYGRARSEAAALAAKDDTAADLKAQCDRVVENIDKAVERAIAQGRDRRAVGYPASARSGLEEAAKVFKATPGQKDIDALLAEWRKDGEFARELSAEKDLQKLLDQLSKDPTKAKSVAKEAARLMTKYGATPVAKRIEPLANGADSSK